MMGRDHAMLGAIGWLAAAPLIHDMGVPNLSRGTLAVGTVLAAGAALLPDLDHPSAAAGRSFPFGQTLAKAVNRVSGGHRHATHSILGVAVVGAGAWWAAGQGFWARTALMFALFALAAHLLVTHRMIFSLAAATAATAATVHWLPAGRWLAVAVIVGCTSHVAGDMLNPERCPLFWPGPWRLGVGLFRTGHWGERVASCVMAGGVAWLAWLRF